MNEIETLSLEGVNVNCVNEEGLTPLLQLAKHDNNTILESLDLGSFLPVVDVEYKLRRCAVFNYPTNSDFLMEAMKLLLRCGIEINCKDKNGWNALHYLCQYYSEDNLIDIMKLLIASGIDVRCKNNLGCTALHLLFQRPSTQINSSR